jgi:phytoene dehydrogenase-like protein
VVYQPPPGYSPLKEILMSDRLRHLDPDAVFDAIIVGSGFGGLVTAGFLAKSGKRVLVLDQHYVAGGCATIFKRREYEFDVGIHYLGDCEPNGLIPRIVRAAGAVDFEFEEMDPDGFDTLVFPDLTFRIPRGIEAFRDRLLDTFPKEARGIKRYIKLLYQLRRYNTLMGNPRAAWKILPRSMMLARWMNRTFGEFLDSCTDDPKLRAVITGQHGDYGQPPRKASLVLGAALSLHYLEGAYFPKGGGQVLSDRLAESIEKNRGKILLRASVEKILIEDGRAVGVQFHNKHVGSRQLKAPIIISNADYKKTMLDLVGAEHLQPDTVNRIKEYRMSPGLVALYLGINRDLKAENHPRTNYWISDNYSVEGLYEMTEKGEFPGPGFGYISIASVKDPTNQKLAPEGITNLQVMGIAPSSYISWGVDKEAYESGAYSRDPRYLAQKRRVSDALIETAERVFPGLKEQIVYQELSTPLTHTRYTRASNGTSYGIALTPDQFLKNRPSSRTEIEGLYLCGASCRAGHGIAGVALSGLQAAARVLGYGLIEEVMGPENKV